MQPNRWWKENAPPPVCRSPAMEGAQGWGAQKWGAQKWGAQKWDAQKWDAHGWCVQGLGSHAVARRVCTAPSARDHGSTNLNVCGNGTERPSSCSSTRTLYSPLLASAPRLRGTSVVYPSALRSTE